MTDLSQAALEQMLDALHKDLLTSKKRVALAPTTMYISPNDWFMYADSDEPTPEEEHYAARNGE